MNKDIAIALIAILAVAGLTFAMDKTIPDKPLTPSEPFRPGFKSGSSSSAAAEDKSPVIVRVNGEPITEQDFKQIIETQPPEQRAMFETAQGRQQLADELVRMKVLEQEARKLGLDRSAEVRDQMDMVEMQILANEAMQKLAPVPTEAELRAEYQKQRTQFETVELSHILVAYQGGTVPPRTGQPPTAEQAMQKANAIAARLRAGANFAQLAQTESDDLQTAQQGGTLGQVPMAALPPELAAVVANLKQGETSNAVRGGFGVHVFKAGNRQSRPFEELKPMLEQRMRQDRAQAAMQKAMASAKIDRNEQFFRGANPAAPQPGGKPQS